MRVSIIEDKRVPSLQATTSGGIRPIHLLLPSPPAVSPHFHDQIHLSDDLPPRTFDPPAISPPGRFTPGRFPPGCLTTRPFYLPDVCQR